MAWQEAIDDFGVYGHPRYEQVAFLSAGSFGKVVFARDMKTGGNVALKLIPRNKLESNLSAEAEVLNHARLRHPHIIALHEVFLTDDHLVLVMEYAPGGTLADRVRRGKGMAEGEARWFFQQILFALDYCHRMGIADRDVKLENVLLDDSPRPLVKLADFGLSARCDDLGCTRSRGLCGTPLYMAPELLAPGGGRHVYNAKAADVWSLGVLLYILLTGCCPFQRTSYAQLESVSRMKMLLARIQRVDYLMPLWLSPDCQNLLSSMLVADPSQRPSVQDVMHHPWCCEGLEPQAMLNCNDLFVSRSKANPPAPELIREVKSIIEEACLGPATPMHSSSEDVSVQARTPGSSGEKT